MFSHNGQYFLSWDYHGMSLIETKSFQQIIADYYKFNEGTAIKSIFGANDRCIYTSFSDGTIHKWK